jgi:TolA-binding protein
MTTIDELLSQRRRGALSDADERRLQMAVQTSPEHRLTLLAGEVFDRAGAPQSEDAALIKHVVRQVGGEWSGTFQRVVARRRLSRWISVPSLIAGVAAASFAGHRALQSASVPGAQPASVQSASVQSAVVQSSGALTSNAPARTAPLARALPTNPATAAPPAAAAEMPPEAPPSARTNVPRAGSLADESPSLPLPLAPATPASAAAAPAPLNASVGAVAPTRSSASWNLPKPKPRAVRHAGLEPEVAAVLPLPSAASTPASLSAGEPAGPDLESAPALFRRATELRQSDWDGAAALYERLALRHTESREAGVAEMALGKHALSEGRALAAVQWFEAYQRRPGGELTAEALWGEARALQSLGEAERARELWARLIEQYPASAYAAAAREQLGP